MIEEIEKYFPDMEIISSDIEEKIQKTLAKADFNKTKDDVIKALNKEVLDFDDFCALLSNPAKDLIEELAKRAKDSERKNIIFCGVKFMAESAKILNPDKHVFIPRKDAGCAMADMVTPDDVIKLKEAHPNACAVCYINSSAATKAECDMCVTSSNALDIISALPQKEIIFVPDKNLGDYIAERLPEKVFYIHSGYCPVHKNISHPCHIRFLQTLQLVFYYRPDQRM